MIFRINIAVDDVFIIFFLKEEKHKREKFESMCLIFQI